MRKYLVLFGLSWQKQLETRSDFVFERTRAMSILFSVYFLWSAFLSGRQGVFGYEREQILSYVLLMTILRAWVLSCVTDRIPMEIARGHLTELLLRPIRPVLFWATQDAAAKVLNVLSALIEVAIFAWLVRAPFGVPPSAEAAFAFAVSVVLAMILYFQMSYALGVMGFWASQSWGPRFCFEVLLEFCAGAYFPVDLLPAAAQKVLFALPFPYLVFQPASIYLGRVPADDWMRIVAVPLVWVVILGVALNRLWAAGLRQYGAEGR